MRNLYFVLAITFCAARVSGQNNDCYNAAPIACGQSINDSTTAATDDLVPNCGTTISAAGVWYAFTGTGGFVYMTTCGGTTDYDSKLNVYTNDCDSLVCVAGNDDSEFCGLASEVLFPTLTGANYYVLVQGYNDDQGHFTLSMDCPDCVPPQNTSIVTLDTMALVFWDSFNPAGDYLIEYGPGGFTPGTGTVITGTDGVDGPPAMITGLAPGTDYDIYVSADCGGSTSVEIGPYGFTTNTDPAPVNAFCFTATPITCGASLVGTTNGSIVTPGPTCASANINTPGVWYSFTGNGDDVLLSTCNQANYDSKISVFTGDCDSLVCAGGNDDGPGCALTSQVILPTTPGTEYLVLVHGYDGSTGDFTLSMLCAGPCAPAVPNDECADALAVVPQMLGACTPLTGTNLCAYGSALPNPPCDPYANIADVWYVFNSGSNTDFTFLLEAVGAAEVNMALYEACGTTTYIDCFTEVAAPVDITGLDTNTDYLVRIWNGGVDDAGSFTFCVETDLSTSVTEVLTTSWTVHPNPAADQLLMNGPGTIDRLTISDAQGRVVRSSVLPGRSIDVSALAAGSYVLRIEAGDAVSLVRFMRAATR